MGGYPAWVYNTLMSEDINPDVNVCALLTEMVTAREGDVSYEFQAVVRAMQRLRDYNEEEDVFAPVCVGLDVTVTEGKVEIIR